jgi:cytochrome c553
MPRPYIRLFAILLLLSWEFRPQTAEAQDNPATGRRLAEAFGCGDCHDPLAKNPPPTAPYIDGQKKSYLLRQMGSFRTARPTTPGPSKMIERRHEKMDARLKALSDADIGHLAEYYAGLRCVPRRTFGETDIPRPPLHDRCQFCHGDTGAVPYIAYPNIGGQNKSYLIEQLKSFRTSARHYRDGPAQIKDERFHRTMSPSTFDLTDAQIESIADFYSKQSCR